MHHRLLSESKKKYLIALMELDPEAKGIRSIAIANHLQVTRPSVHAMLTRLSDDGYLNKEHYGIVYLTEKGQEVGQKLVAHYGHNK